MWDCAIGFCVVALPWTPNSTRSAACAREDFRAKVLGISRLNESRVIHSRGSTCPLIDSEVERASCYSSTAVKVTLKIKGVRWQKQRSKFSRSRGATLSTVATQGTRQIPNVITWHGIVRLRRRGDTCMITCYVKVVSRQRGKTEYPSNCTLV